MEDALTSDRDDVATFVIGRVFPRRRIIRALQGSRFMVVEATGDATSLSMEDESPRRSMAIVEAGDGSGNPKRLARTIRQRAPRALVVLAGDFGHSNWLLRPLAWADGLVQSDAPGAALIASLDLITMGAAVLPTALVGLLAKQAQITAASDGEQHPRFDEQRFIDLQIRRLSDLERAVLECLKEGITNKIIARRLDLTVSAVTVAMKGVLRKLGVQNRTQAAFWALENLPDDKGATE